MGSVAVRIMQLFSTVARDKCMECERLLEFEDLIDEEREEIVETRTWQDINAEMEGPVSRRLQDRI